MKYPSRGITLPVVPWLPAPGGPRDPEPAVLKEQLPMYVEPGDTVRSRKLGSEDIIMASIPAERLQGSGVGPNGPHFSTRNRLRVALLAQMCESYSFDHEQVGRTDECHLWLWVASEEPISPISGADTMLPSTSWLSLFSAADNERVRERLRSFGFRPGDLEAADLHGERGMLVFADKGTVTWTFTGAEEDSRATGVNHLISMAGDLPGVPGHQVSALLRDAMMVRPGKLNVHTDALEPFLHAGERLPVVVNRVRRLEARITWQRHA